MYLAGALRGDQVVRAGEGIQSRSMGSGSQGCVRSLASSNSTSRLWKPALGQTATSGRSDTFAGGLRLWSSHHDAGRSSVGNGYSLSGPAPQLIA